MRGMHETTPIPDTYCSGLGAIEDLGSDLRFHLYVLQTEEDGHEQQRVVVAKIIAPKSAVPDAILQMVAAIGAHAVQLIPMMGEFVN